MMRLATPQQSLEIDRRTQREYALPADILMEAAGALAAYKMPSLFPALTHNAHIAILCGPGHNGGDGMVVARHLVSAGYTHVSVFLVGANKKPSELFTLQKRRCKELQIPIKTSKMFDAISQADVIVDAIFGVGLNRPIGEIFGDVIAYVNACDVPVIALDGPSGLDAETGQAWGMALRADHTLTFGLSKPGFYLQDGPRCAGEIHVLPIGFPPKIIREVAHTHQLHEEKVIMK